MQEASFPTVVEGVNPFQGSFVSHYSEGVNSFQGRFVSHNHGGVNFLQLTLQCKVCHKRMLLTLLVNLVSNEYTNENQRIVLCQKYYLHRILWFVKVVYDACAYVVIVGLPQGVLKVQNQLLGSSVVVWPGYSLHQVCYPELYLGDRFQDCMSRFIDVFIAGKFDLASKVSTATVALPNCLRTPLSLWLVALQ